jgi:hypothetical protein
MGCRINLHTQGEVRTNAGSEKKRKGTNEVPEKQTEQRALTWL